MQSTRISPVYASAEIVAALSILMQAGELLDRNPFLTAPPRVCATMLRSSTLRQPSRYALRSRAASVRPASSSSSAKGSSSSSRSTSSSAWLSLSGAGALAAAAYTVSTWQLSQGPLEMDAEPGKKGQQHQQQRGGAGGGGGAPLFQFKPNVFLYVPEPESGL